MTAFAVPVRRMKCSYVDNELALPDTPLARMAAEEVLQGTAYPRVDGLEHIRTIVDVGANVGMSALYFHQLYPDAAIHCFEPSPTSCELLAYNTRSIPGCKIYPWGLWDTTELRTLFAGEYDCVQDSLFHSADEGPTAQRTVNVKNASNALSGILPIDILKIDTEGAEASILESLGIAHALGLVRAVYVETHSYDQWWRSLHAIDGTHCLYRGKQDNAFRGEWVFLRHDVHARIAEKNKEIV